MTTPTIDEQIAVIDAELDPDLRDAALPAVNSSVRLMVQVVRLLRMALQERVEG